MYVLTSSLRITVAACWTVSRRAVTVGSRDLTTASANLGRLVYNTKGFYVVSSTSVFTRLREKKRKREREKSSLYEP